MSERANQNLKRVVRDLLILAAIMLAMWAALAHGDSVRLLDEAAIAGSDIRVSDIADLEGNDAANLGDIVIARLKTGDNATTISLDALREKLNAAGVNWGKVSLRGYAACRVGRVVKEETVVEEAPAAVVANFKGEVAAGAAVTVRDHLIEIIAKLTKTDRADLKIKFAESDAKALAVGTLNDRFEFEPQSATGLGRVPVVVRRWSGDRLAETLRVTAEVSRRQLAVVTVNGLSRGQVLTAGDVEMQEVYTGSTTAAPVTDVQLAVGQVAVNSLRPKSIVFVDSIRPPVLVKRGDLISIRCVSGAVVVKIIGRAMEEGAVDQVIQVRNERSRETLRVRVTGQLEGVIAEEQPADTKAGKGGRGV